MRMTVPHTNAVTTTRSMMARLVTRLVGTATSGARAIAPVSAGDDDSFSGSFAFGESGSTLAMVRRLRTSVLSFIVVVGAVASPVGAASGATIRLEGREDSARWVEIVAESDLAVSVPALASVGTIEAITPAACSSQGAMTELEFSGAERTERVSAVELAGALGLDSSEIVIAGVGSGIRPGCWSTDPPTTETRAVRSSLLTITGGDGDGIAECSETLELEVTMASVTESIVGGTLAVEVRGEEASLVGPSWSPISDLAPGQSRTAAEPFTITIADDVSGADWATIGIAIGTDDAVYESHRHIPITCGAGGDASAPGDLVFPVAGPNRYRREWLTTHNPLIHEGVDIFASRRIPVLAMADGVVADVNFAHDPFHVDEPECCSVAVIHDSGWESWYLHLDNDTPGTDDGLGWGVMPGIERGVRVEAGQIIGFMGDSSNAEGTAPHLHLELHDPAGNPVDPYDALVAAPVVDPICTSTDDVCFPFVVLSWYSRDPQVAVLQTRLAQAGFTPGIADGVFGTRTDRAVRGFQEAAGLEVDGLVDEQTWDELHRVVANDIDLVPSTIARRGDRGPVVVEIQTLLAQHGFSPGPVDGIYGTLTETAATRFQSARGIAATGVVDATTFDRLSGAGGDSASGGDETASSRLVRVGDRGPVVVEIQTLLAERGFSPGFIDGIYGSLTARAVRSFQAAAGIGVDGVVGTQTLDALNRNVSRVVIAQRGDHGPSVVEIQNLLAAAGFSPGPVDGWYGVLTAEAVRSFQTDAGLRVDGVVDEATSAALSG